MIIDETTYKLLTIAGSWLAGIGSLSAVITSLWLARRTNTIRLGIIANHVQIITPGIKGSPDYMQISIVNKGVRPANITSVGWAVGLFKKQYAVQLFGDTYSDTLPKLLNEGEEVKLLVKFHDNLGDDDWIISFPKKFLFKNPKFRTATMKSVVYTSVGQNFKKRIEKTLRKVLLKATQKLKQ